MKRYTCLRASSGRWDFDTFGDAVDACDPQDASEKYVKENHGDWNYPESVVVVVRDEETGVTTEVGVQVEMVPAFYGEAREHDHPRLCDHRIVGGGRCYGCMKQGFVADRDPWAKR